MENSDDIIEGMTHAEIMEGEVRRLNHEITDLKEMIRSNKEILEDALFPLITAVVVEVLELEQDESEGSDILVNKKHVVVKTSTRESVLVPPVPGLVDYDELNPGDLVSISREKLLIVEKLPPEYDSRVEHMVLESEPTVEFSDVGGLEHQIQELCDAVVLPFTHLQRFKKLGISQPKGVLFYGPPGTGKTLLARACAARTDAAFIRLAGPILVQKYMGEGAKIVWDVFKLAKEIAPCIIFVDEVDAFGTKRFNSEACGQGEVQRTMLEFLNQLDGFSSDDRIKVIAATNRVDVLDPALMRSGRLDRKIELPYPNEKARARILQIHSRFMNNKADVNFEELARSTDGFNGAQLKFVCVEAGMQAIRRDAIEINHEDYVQGISEVQGKKKRIYEYFG
ncbi:hypothetical protein MKX03_025783 [Papaver bracteatum]|nr:hypothetical protein MKX03_025783 [Papaver bracteatum]